MWMLCRDIMYKNFILPQRKIKQKYYYIDVNVQSNCWFWRCFRTVICTDIRFVRNCQTAALVPDVVHYSLPVCTRMRMFQENQSAGRYFPACCLGGEELVDLSKSDSLKIKYAKDFQNYRSTRLCPIVAESQRAVWVIVEKIKQITF